MFRGEYSVNDLDFREHAKELDKVHGVDESSESISPEYVPSKGSNYDSLQVGCNGDEVVILKPGDVNFGRAGPAHVAAARTAEELDFNCPDVWYDKEEEMIIMTHQGPLSKPREDVDKEGIAEAVIPKIVAGDPDIIPNIGYTGERWLPYDFDQAGRPLSDVEEELASLSQLSDIKYEPEDFMTEASKQVSKIDINEHVSELEETLDKFFPKELGFNTFDIQTYEHNLMEISGEKKNYSSSSPPTTLASPKTLSPNT